MRVDINTWRCPECGFATMGTNSRTCPNCQYNGDWIQPGQTITYSEHKRMKGLVEDYEGFDKAEQEAQCF